ncbi:DUF551 domain-containing protein, partial [Citrobacter portucalensis]|uniref:DUF551 domain-containing protein n=1 Tax=Citrobacter portucalensis TaxID=1639133 RepID=UPI001F14C06A
AHGPVSLDRLHQIREILSKASAQSDGGNLGYAMADAVKVIDGAIAAFGAEPVGITDRNEIECLKRGEMANVMPPDYKGVDNGDDVYVYTAPPAPVSVPAAMEMDDDFDSAFEHGKAVGWNAYRAAMLQSFGNSEQLNSPVIPDGWVACSELMPEQFKAILAFNEYGEVWSGAYDRYWNFYCDNLLVEHVTHWMPLPAAPQQEA